MISCNDFFELLHQHHLDFYTGVPDSLLKDFCAYVNDHTDKQQHIIAANEGNAIAIATGYHLATKKIGIVYLQNSGLGNCINPLTSLTDPEIYSIPLLLLIGWRAEPNVQDEPQHKKMGKIMVELLNTLGVSGSILPQNIIEAKESLSNAIDHIKKKSAPYALIIKKKTFETYKSKSLEAKPYPLSREEAIQGIISQLKEEDIVISTTGKASRELFEIRNNLQQNHHKDFLTVGSMGHASSIALGISLQKNNRKVYCIDGDGALIMHQGSIATIGKCSPNNFYHVIINNYSHESVGGQPTAADIMDFTLLAKANGYKESFTAENEAEIKLALETMKKKNGPILLEIKCNKSSRENLGRPTIAPIDNKKDFMRFLEN